MVFQHQLFTRDNPDPQLIHRKGKAVSRELNESEVSVKIKEEVNQLKEKDLFMGELLEKLNVFKEKNGRTITKLKVDLEKLQKMVSSKKGRVVKNYVSEIKDKLRSIVQVEKKVDSLITHSSAQSDSPERTFQDSKKEDE